MTLQRRGVLRLLVAAAAAPAMPRLTRADTYPSRPVHVIVGFGPGGSGA
jgi:tripartite-type tricarboxylate transporter receptor subunit TctC